MQKSGCQLQNTCERHDLCCSSVFKGELSVFHCLCRLWLMQQQKKATKEHQKFLFWRDFTEDTLDPVQSGVIVLLIIYLISFCWTVRWPFVLRNSHCFEPVCLCYTCAFAYNDLITCDFVTLAVFPHAGEVNLMSMTPNHLIIFFYPPSSSCVDSRLALFIVSTNCWMN